MNAIADTLFHYRTATSCAVHCEPKLDRLIAPETFNLDI